MMKKKCIVAILFLCALSVQAQERTINIQMADGKTTQTRLAELDEISFLTVDEGGQGLLVNTIAGETIAVLFETSPVVTISNGKLKIKTDSETVELEIADIAEILFGDASPASISQQRDFLYVLQEGGAVIRGIADGIKAHVYTVDGKSILAPAVRNGELQLNRDSLGTGVFIVKIGTSSIKIKL